LGYGCCRIAGEGEDHVPQHQDAVQFRAAGDACGNPCLGAAIRPQAFRLQFALNAEAFNRAVSEVSDSARRLLAALQTQAPARDREVEAAKAKERSRARFG
jgi:hypothetical protein